MDTKIVLLFLINKCLQLTKIKTLSEITETQQQASCYNIVILKLCKINQELHIFENTDKILKKDIVCMNELDVLSNRIS